MTELDKLEQVIADALGMEVRHLKMRSKKVEVVEYRFMTAMIIRMLYKKKYSYRQVGIRWGYEHDRIMYMEQRGKELVEIRDILFMIKWIKVLENIVKYLGKEYCQNLQLPEVKSRLVALQ